MRTRIFSGIVMIPVIAITIILGNEVLLVSTLIISLIAMNEFFRAVYHENKKPYLEYVGYAFVLLYYALLPYVFPSRIWALFIIFMLCLIVATVFHFEEYTFQDVVYTAFGFFYGPFLLSFLYLTRELDRGLYIVPTIFICSFVCDTAAYFTGKFFGKHKLTKLSPKKTIEGSVGGVLVAASVSAVYGYFVLQGAPVWVHFSIGVIGAILSQFGDLFASYIKRQVGIKDYGTIIPGHGGILDRFDSVIVIAPMIYAMCDFVIR